MHFFKFFAFTYIYITCMLHAHHMYTHVLSFRILSYHGQLEISDTNRPTAVRTCVHAGCSHNLLDYLREIGFV